MLPKLTDCDLETLRRRFGELDYYAQAQETGQLEMYEIADSIFALGGTEEDGWNNYHLVRNEYGRRAAEEFDLGQ